MSCHGRRIRLNRILHGPGHRALVVAFDHPLVLGPIEGTVNPAQQVRQFVENGADAVLLNIGILPRVIESVLAPTAPAVILRLDWSSLWTADSSDGKLISHLLATPDQALRLGADAVLTYLFVGTGDAEFESREVQRNAEVARECERVGIPLIVESLARGKQVKDPLAPEWMKLHTRIAAELGADLIKTEFAGTTEKMKQVVDICPVPILVLGGERRSSEAEALAVVRDATAAGAAGVFFGRNVFQSSSIPKFLRKVRSILDERQDPKRALAGVAE